MPNHCQNRVLIKGKHKDIMQLQEFVKGKGTPAECNPFSFQSIIPMPIELEGTKSPPDKPNPELIAKYGEDNWYDWHLKNWNTKWNSYETQLVKETPRTLHYEFTTAWSPPTAVLKALSVCFPEVRITDIWREEGGQRGTIYCENGEVLYR